MIRAVGIGGDRRRARHGFASTRTRGQGRGWARPVHTGGFARVGGAVMSRELALYHRHKGHSRKECVSEQKLCPGIVA